MIKHLNSGLVRPSIFEIAKAFDDGNEGVIMPKTNITINTNRLWYGKDSTVSAFIAIAYDERGNWVDSMNGYFLEPATDYELAKKEGRDRAIMSGEYEIVSQAEMKKRLLKRRKENGENIEEKDITLRYNWYIDNPPGRSGIAIHGGRTGRNTTGCFIPGASFEYDEQKDDYMIINSKKKEELFDFLNKYGQNGIKINVGPEVSELVE